MKKTIKKVVKRIIGKGTTTPVLTQSEKDNQKIAQYIAGGRIPWSEGYIQYKWDFINKSVNDIRLLEIFSKKEKLPDGYGIGLDDRSVEYPWIFSRLRDDKSIVLDAGSTLNFRTLVNHKLIKNKDLTILTFYPEKENFNSNRISYVYADLRLMPLRDNWFDEIVCQSTLEHIGMDNSMYGYKNAADQAGKEKDYSHLEAISELVRVLKPGGQLLLTFPFGKYEYHGFFQQFDNEMLERMIKVFNASGIPSVDYMVYTINGWEWSSNEKASFCESYNPHTGVGKGSDGAAHSRAICAVSFIKK